MKKITFLKASNYLEEKPKIIIQDRSCDVIRKFNRTPEAINNNRRKLNEGESNNRIQNLAISFDQPNNFRKWFKNREEYWNYLFY